MVKNYILRNFDNIMGVVMFVLAFGMFMGSLYIGMSGGIDHFLKEHI
jgi:hypothetical protein